MKGTEFDLKLGTCVNVTWGLKVSKQKFSEGLAEFKDNCTLTHSQNMNVSSGNDSFSILKETEMPLAEIFKLTFEALIALFGVIGNVLVVIVIGSLGKKKQPGDFYLQNLAIADLGTLLFTFPFAVIKEKAPLNWPLGEFTCLYLYPIPEIFYGATVWYIAVIAIGRYRNIVKVKTNGKSKNKTLLKRAKCVAVCLWVISFLIFCFPLYFVVEYKELSNGRTMCRPVWSRSWDRQWLLGRVYMGGILTFFSYILPLTVITFTYLRISRVINRSSLFIRAMRQGERNTTEDRKRLSLPNIKSVRLKQNKRAKKILTPLVLVFAITMLPLNIFRLIIVSWPAIATQKYYGNLLYAVSVFVILNSSVNPIIYSVVSRDFRKGINNLFRRRWSRSQSSLYQLFHRDSGHQFSTR